jgi:hypothetical protein
VEAEASEKGVSHRQIIESALYDRYEARQQPSRDAIIARRLNRIDNRLKVIEWQDEIVLELLGAYVRMWLMVNEEVPQSERKIAYEQSLRRFEVLTSVVADNIRLGQGMAFCIPKERGR